MSLGLPGTYDPSSPVVDAALRRIAEVALDRGVVPGIYVGSIEFARRMLQYGYRHLVFSGDIRMLAAASAAARAELESAIAAAGASAGQDRRPS